MSLCIVYAVTSRVVSPDNSDHVPRNVMLGSASRKVSLTEATGGRDDTEKHSKGHSTLTVFAVELTEHMRDHAALQEKGYHQHRLERKGRCPDYGASQNIVTSFSVAPVSPPASFGTEDSAATAAVVTIFCDYQ
jgi:hypothetical protein